MFCKHGLVNPQMFVNQNKITSHVHHKINTLALENCWSAILPTQPELERLVALLTPSFSSML